MSNKKKKQAAQKPASASGASRFRELKKETRELLARAGKDMDSFKIVEGAYGGVKMSDVLAAVADPYLKRCRNNDDIERIFELAVMAWNESFMFQMKGIKPTENWHERLFSPPLLPADSPTVKAILEDMMNRRRILFPDIGRFVVAHRVTFSGRTIDLKVTSIPFSEIEKDGAWMKSVRER